METHVYNTQPNPGDEVIETTSCIQCTELIPKWVSVITNGLCTNCSVAKMNKKPPKEPRCRAKTKHGTVCHKRAQPGRSLCYLHYSDPLEVRRCATCQSQGYINTKELVTFFHASGTDVQLCDKHFIEMCNAAWPVL